MTLQGQPEVILLNPQTVINDSDQAFTAGLQCNANGLRTCVQAVFDQLLDHRCRSVNDFAGSDLVDQVIREGSDGHFEQLAGCLGACKVRHMKGFGKRGVRVKCQSELTLALDSDP